MKVGLFFGSFNPVHIGHLAIVNYIVEYTDLDEVWMVVSPQNPFKQKKNLLNEYERYQMLTLALGGSEKIKPTDIEFRLPKPSYTIDTLTYLKEKYPKNDFVIIMGSDNLASFHKWKNSEIILQHHLLYVYPRPGFGAGTYAGNPGVKMVAAPLMEISSGFIRGAIKNKKDVRFFIPEKVYEYILNMNFYTM